MIDDEDRATYSICNLEIEDSMEGVGLDHLEWGRIQTRLMYTSSSVTWKNDMCMSTRGRE